MLIKVILIISFVVLFWTFLTSTSSYHVSALRKLATLIFTILAIFAIIFPDTTNDLAHWVGIKRGADLLLYFLTLCFIFAMMRLYIKGQDSQQKIVTLARQLAILEAKLKQQDKEND